MDAPNSTVPDYLSLLGYLFLRHGKMRRAITMFEALLVLRPDSVQARRSLAYALLVTGNHQSSLDELDRASALGPVNTHDQLLRIRALWGLGRHTEARTMVRELNGRLRIADV